MSARSETCDVVVLGSGFAGSLSAVIARRAGHKVVMIERNHHPLFAIGESSTPLASLKLETLANTYDLPWLTPFANYGEWKRVYPQIACGLKRGFSFFHHTPGKPFRPRPSGETELLVEANPDEQHGDAHWFRADFDAFFVERAVAMGVVYLDECEIKSAERDGGWCLYGADAAGDVEVRATFVIDATGESAGEGAFAEATGNHVSDRGLRTRSRGLYGHFKNVGRWSEVLSARGHRFEKYSFDTDTSALHHVIEGGWMWVLRFDNGVTSAGFSLDPERHPMDPSVTPEQEWRKLLGSYPSIRRQFVRAKPVAPLARTGRMQRRLDQIAGADWAALPHAAGFIDPFLSAGIAFSLFGVERLGRILTEHWASPDREQHLADYAGAVMREMRRVDRIVSACYQTFDRFDVMVSVSMLYFVAAIYAEERIRAGKSVPSDEFLLAHDEAFAKIIGKIGNSTARDATGGGPAFASRVHRMIEPYNTAGLCDPERRNVYPFNLGGIRKNG